MSDKRALFLELQELDEKIKKLHGHMEEIEEQIAELQNSRLVVNKFMELNKGEEMRVPLANGVYFKATLTDVENLLVNVGAGVSVEKSPKQVADILDDQLVELNEYRENIISQVRENIARVEEIQSETE